MPGRLWYETGTTAYGISGGRDVLIIAPAQPIHNPEAVARRPGQLTEEDKQTLLSQGVSPEGQDEVAIVKARCQLDKWYRIVGVKSGQLSREEVMKSIRQLLTTTKSDGGIYILLFRISFRNVFFFFFFGGGGGGGGGGDSNIRHMQSAAKNVKPCTLIKQPMCM